MAICLKSCCRRLGMFRRVEFWTLIFSWMVMTAIWSCSRLLRSRFWLAKGTISWPPRNLKTDFSCRTRAETVHEQHLPLLWSWLLLMYYNFSLLSNNNMWYSGKCTILQPTIFNSEVQYAGNFAAFQIATSLWRKKKVQLPWELQVRSSFNWWIMECLSLVEVWLAQLH